MKNFLFTFLGLFLLLPSAEANNDKDINSKIKNVTIYLNGAQVSRKGKVVLKKGVNTLYFNNVSPYVNQKTIQVQGLGDYIILDSKKGIKYPKPEENKAIPNKITQRIIKMRDSVQDLDFENRSISVKIQNLDTEKNLLLKNNVFNKDTLPTVKASLSYLRQQLSDLNDLDQQYRRRQTEISELRTKINRRISDLNNYNKNNVKPKESPVNQIIVTVQAKREMTGSMTVTYFVSNASWSPSYDIRVKDINTPVDLTMKATVYQNTGEDWKNVKLTLSTNNPYKNKVKPELSTWFINYYNPNIGYYQDAKKTTTRLNEVSLNSVRVASADMATESLSTNSYYKDKEKLPSAVRSTKYTVKSQTMANVEYKIDLNYTIKADNQAHLVAVNQQSIKANYNHYLVPKYDKESYLVAELVDWEDLDLLPSKANLYYGGSYIGETRINPTANDTLYISLGNDRNVRIKRTKDAEKSRDKVFSNRKTTTVSYDLIVKNMSTRKYNIIVEDHIPVSQDKTIVVSVENKSRAKLNEKTGMMVWKFTLNSKQTKELNYTYKVEYDNNKPLDLSKL
ncbi:MAG: mucoidy inhibitor MuiA family protein [Flavobacteriales bacterium]|nr:mucoidy inhibitor MuiA family protein [Flavobacteriales bacterium]